MSQARLSEIADHLNQLYSCCLMATGCQTGLDWLVGDSPHMDLAVSVRPWNYDMDLHLGAIIACEMNWCLRALAKSGDLSPVSCWFVTWFYKTTRGGQDNMAVSTGMGGSTRIFWDLTQLLRGFDQKFGGSIARTAGCFILERRTSPNGPSDARAQFQESMFGLSNHQHLRVCGTFLLNHC